MKRKSFLLILLFALCNCRGLMMEGGSDYYEQIETRKQQIWVWASAERANVEAGTLKNSEYWKLFFRKTEELRPDLDNYLFFANEMIKVSRILEEGKITREQFEDKNRQLSTLLDREDSRRATILSRTHMIVNYETTLFICYRTSLFRDYANNLQIQLSQAGPQFSGAHCDFFGNSIQCTTLNPSFP